jgi:perosamine synthetase
MMKSRVPLPYGRQTIDADDVAAVARCLEDPWLTQGPRVAEFEAGLVAATGARFAVAVSSGTAALHLAALAAGVSHDDVVITSAISFVATANAMAYCGARVAFCDVDRQTGLLDLDSLESQVDQLSSAGLRPKWIVPVDFAGQPVDRARVQAIASRSGARVLEDCAHSLGARYRVGGETFQVGSCAHADLAILSFHPVKHITTGEGGAVLTNDARLADVLRELRSHGISRDPARLQRPSDDPLRGPWYYEQTSLGMNYRITDLQCALGTSQLTKLPRFLERRKALASLYDAALAEAPLCDALAPLASGRRDEHAHHLYVVRVRSQPGEPMSSVARRRRALYEALVVRGIQPQVHYIPIPWHPYWQGRARLGAGPWPGAEAFYAAVLSLPLFPAMTDDDVARTVTALRESVGTSTASRERIRNLDGTSTASPEPDRCFTEEAKVQG